MCIGCYSERGMDPSSTLHVMENLARDLRQYRYSFQREVDLQGGVWEAFQKSEWSLEVRREYVLGPKDRVDFWVEGSGIAVELKTMGPLSKVVSQVARYAAHDSVHGVLLVTTSQRLARGMPDTLAGKPVRGVLLSGGLF